MNPAERSLDKRLARTVAEHERILRELRSPQKSGGDVLSVGGYPEDGYLPLGPLTVPSTASGTFIVSFTPPFEILTIWNMLWSINVDTDDTAHQWPNGSSLTGGQRNFSAASWFDWGDSDDLLNIRVYKIHIRNLDSSSHDYYLRIRAYLPFLAGVTGS